MVFGGGRDAIIPVLLVPAAAALTYTLKRARAHVGFFFFGWTLFAQAQTNLTWTHQQEKDIDTPHTQWEHTRGQHVCTVRATTQHTVRFCVTGRTDQCDPAKDVQRHTITRHK